MGYISSKHKQRPWKRHRKSHCGHLPQPLHEAIPQWPLPKPPLWREHMEMCRVGLGHPSQNRGWITFSHVLIWLEGVRTWSNTCKHCQHLVGKSTHQINLIILLAFRADLWMLHPGLACLANFTAVPPWNQLPMGVPGVLAQLGKGVWATLILGVR